MRNLDPQTIRL